MPLYLRGKQEHPIKPFGDRGNAEDIGLFPEDIFEQRLIARVMRVIYDDLMFGVDIAHDREQSKRGVLDKVVQDILRVIVEDGFPFPGAYGKYDLHWKRFTATLICIYNVSHLL